LLSGEAFACMHKVSCSIPSTKTKKAKTNPHTQNKYQNFLIWSSSNTYGFELLNPKEMITLLDISVGYMKKHIPYLFCILQIWNGIWFPDALEIFYILLVI
jgi:hypothetical protein